MANSRQFFLGTIAFLAMVAIISPLREAFFGMVKLVFEGNSYGKMYLFLFFAALFFGFLWLGETRRGRHSRHGNESQGNLRNFAICVGAMFIISLALQGLLLYSYGARSQNSSIMAFYERPGFLEWEASFLQHTHTGKVSFALVSQLLPLNFAQFDSGMPLYSITPFAPFFGAIFVILTMLAIYFALLEAHRIYSGEITPDLLVWLLASFGFILLSMDGGIFTLGAQISIALGAYYFFRNNPAHNFSPLEQFFFPLLVSGGIQFILSFVFVAQVSAGYSLLVAGIILVPATILNNPGKVNWKLWALFGIALVAVAGDAYVSLAVGKIMFPGKQVELFVYGLPENLTQEQLRSALSERLEVQKIEKLGWIASVQAMPKSLYTTGFLENDLRQKFNPKGYLYVVQMSRSPGITLLQSNEPLGKLLSAHSDFMEFGKAEVEGKEYFTIKSKLNRVYSGLWVLNYLRYSEGKRGAVVITT